MKKLYQVIIILTALILVLFLVVLPNIFTDMIIHPSWHKPGLDHNCSPSQFEYAKIVCIDNPESAIKEKFETVKLQINPDVYIEGWYFPGVKKSDKLVIFVHGAGVDRRNGYKLVPFLIKAGISVFLYDSPNHGRSSNNGKGVSYGIRESEAFPLVVDWGHTKADHVFVIATSAGASTVTLAKDKWVGKIEAIVFENPLLSLIELVKVNAIARSLPGFYLNYIFKFVEWKGGFKPEFAAPKLYLDKFPDIPVIVMHGTDDKTIPFYQGKKFYDELKVSNKQFYKAEKTDHCRVWDKYPVQFESMTLNLFGR